MERRLTQTPDSAVSSSEAGTSVPRVVFFDGFESGDVSAWNESVP